MTCLLADAKWHGGASDELAARHRCDAGLQIAVYDALLMRLIESVGDLDGKPRRLIQRQRASLQSIGQRFPFEVFHDEEIDPVVLADIVENTDVRMPQCRDSLRLPKKTLAPIRIVAKMRRQDLDCDCAIEAGVFGAIHLAHPARTYRDGNFVRP
jgi:hypothetical protein